MALLLILISSLILSTQLVIDSINGLRVSAWLVISLVIIVGIGHFVGI